MIHNSPMPSRKLGQLCKINIGKTPSRSNPAFWNGDHPWLSIADMNQGRHLIQTKEGITSEGIKTSGINIVPKGTLVLSYKLSIGKVGITGRDMFTNEAIAALPIIDPNVLNIDFLYWALKTIDLIESSDRAAMGITLNKAKLRQIPIPLPPLSEQKRIAGILDAADALRAKRREALAQLDTLLQSTFLDMFGDPVTNPMGWEVGRFADIVERLDGGKNVAQSERETSYRILKVSAVTGGEFRPEESKYLPDDFEIPESYIVKGGDLLISRANTSELIGATAYVWKTPRNIVLPDKIWKFIWKKQIEIEPLFIWHLTQNREFRQVLSSRASGTSGSMKNIPKPKLLSLLIPLPPFSLQHRFATIVESVEKQKATMRAHLAELDTLFASLQSRAFNGEL